MGKEPERVVFGSREAQQIVKNDHAKQAKEQELEHLGITVGARIRQLESHIEDDLGEIQYLETRIRDTKKELADLMKMTGEE